MKMFMLMTALGISGYPFTGATTAAPNPESDPAVTEAVSYADLDLRSTIGQKRLRDRVSFAAYRLCLVESPASPSPSIADPVCFQSAMKQGLAQIDQAVARASGSVNVASATPPVK